MKPVVTRLYGVLVVLTLIGLAAWAGADWYQQEQQALREGHSALRAAAGNLSDLTLKSGVLRPEDAAAVLTKLAGTDSRWKVLVLHSPERGTEYYRGPRPAIAVDQAVPHWEPRWGAEVALSLPVFRTGAPALTLDAVYEFYGRAEIFGLLKASGFTLLALLVLTTVLVLLSSSARPSNSGVQSPDSRSPVDPVSPSVEPAFDWDSDDAPDLKVPALSEDRDDEYWFDDELTMEDLPPLEEPRSPSQDGPSLVSPESGLGWESFLDTRLSNELDRASGQNQDLALILLGWRNESVEPRAWGQAIKKAFPSVDMNFEVSRGAALVLPGRTLEQALQAARAFISEADRLWPAVGVCAGVASRTGRLLESKTLVAEAQSALQRTLSGSVRVLGLKTDPDRYRAHLAAEASSAHL